MKGAYRNDEEGGAEPVDLAKSQADVLGLAGQSIGEPALGQDVADQHQWQLHCVRNKRLDREVKILDGRRKAQRQPRLSAQRPPKGPPRPHPTLLARQLNVFVAEARGPHRPSYATHRRDHGPVAERASIRQHAGRSDGQPSPAAALDQASHDEELHRRGEAGQQATEDEQVPGHVGRRAAAQRVRYLPRRQGRAMNEGTVDGLCQRMACTWRASKGTPCLSRLSTKAQAANEVIAH